MKMSQMHKIPKAAKELHRNNMNSHFQSMKKKYAICQKSRGEKVTSEKMKPHYHKYEFQKSLYPSSPGTPSQESTLTTGITLQTPARFSRSSKLLQGHLHNLTHIKKQIPQMLNL